MFTLTRKTDYALVAMAGLAEAAGEPGVTISARELAERYNLPLPILMNVLKELHRAGIIASQRGVNGGYCLADPPERITLSEVLEAMEGPVRLTVCCDDASRDGEACDIESLCPITHSLQRFSGRINGMIGRITLADLLNSTVDVSIEQVGLGAAAR